MSFSEWRYSLSYQNDLQALQSAYNQLMEMSAEFNQLQRDKMAQDIAFNAMMAQRDSVSAQNEIFRTAIGDWLNTYAPEFCSEARVSEAKKRICENGGTLAYIAFVLDAGREYEDAT